MKKIDVKDAIGHVLCHDLTRIVVGEMKGVQFRKGHVIQPDDIPMLLSMGKEHLYVWELATGFLHENDAAFRLAAICHGEGMTSSDVHEGKIELKAAVDGVFVFEPQKLEAVNSIDQIIIAARHNHSKVSAGDKLAGMRVIPLVIDEKKIIAAEAVSPGEPLMNVMPFRLKNAGIITTGNEIKAGRIRDTFTPVLVDKLKCYGVEVVRHAITGDDPEVVAAAISEMKSEGLEMILCTGGMSVDPDDNTPGSIRKSGARIVTYGAPVLPGAMLMLGYFEDGTVIAGLPGCVMYAKATVFDLVLPLIVAGIPLTKQDFVSMGNGGLCLGCPECHYPICSFGKGF